MSSREENPDNREKSEKHGALSRIQEFRSLFCKDAESTKALFDSLFDGMVIHEDGIILDANENFLKMFLSSLEKVIGRHVKGFMHGDFREDIENRIKEGHEHPYEVRGVRNDGSVFPLEISGKTIRIGNHKLRVKAFRDISYRHDFQEELGKSREKYRMIFNASPIGICLFDEKGVIQEINKACYDIFGIENDSILDIHLFKIFKLTGNQRKKLSAGEMIHLSLPYDFSLVEQSNLFKTHKKGIMNLDVLITPVFLKDKKNLSAYLVQFQDLTSRINIEERNRKLSEALKQSPIAVMITDGGGKIEYINRRFTVLTGYRPEDIIGKTPDILKTDVTSKEVFDKLWDTIKSGKTWSGEFCNRKKNGEIYWENNSISPILDSQGNITHFVAIKEDITESKLQDENIKRENAKLTAMISSMEEGVIFADSNDFTITINDYFCRLSGLNLEDIIYRKLDVLNLDEVNSRLEYFKNTNNAEPYIVQRSLYGAEVIMRIQPIYLDKKYDGVLLNFVNVTALVNARLEAEKTHEELINANMELEIAKQEAENANRSKSEFLANMSHEIRTPLNAILGFSNILLEREPDATQKEYLELINSSGNHLLILINDILDLSKVEAGQFVIEKKKLDIRKIINESVRLIQPRLKGKDLETKIIIDEKVPQYLLGDPEHIRQILLNLLGNASKFTKRGLIQLTATASKNSLLSGFFPLEISISDTGIGISRDQLENIFEPFNRGSKSTERDFEGTGLGLSITKRLIQLMDGDVKVESEAGKGSTFTITIPMEISASEYNEVESLPAGDFPDPYETRTDRQSVIRDHSTMRILLVEDNPVNQKLIEVYLEKTGYSINTASDGEEAIILASGMAFDIILMDVQLPRIDGYEATRIIREKGPNKETPIIALTAHAMKGEKEKAKEAGCDGYLSKPVDRKVLLSTIKAFEKRKCLYKTKEQEKYHRKVDEDIENLVPWYLENLNKEFDIMKKALKEKNLDTIRIKAHGMKGSGSSFGYEIISKYGQKIEADAMEKNTESVSMLVGELQDIIDKINEEHKESNQCKPHRP